MRRPEETARSVSSMRLTGFARLDWLRYRRPRDKLRRLGREWLERAIDRAKAF